MRRDFLNSIARVSFHYRREPSQPFPPKIFPFERAHGFNSLPGFIDFNQFNSPALRVAQEHLTLSRRFQDLMFDCDQEPADWRALWTPEQSIEPKKRG